MLLIFDPILESLTPNTGQNPLPNLKLSTALIQNDETIQDNFTTIDDVTQFLDNHLTEIIHDDPEETILHHPHDEATLAIVEASDDGDTGDAVNANNTVDDSDDDDVRSTSNPLAYSPTCVWIYEPIITLDSDNDV